jgi:hypothetical protein
MVLLAWSPSVGRALGDTRPASVSDGEKPDWLQTGAAANALPEICGEEPLAPLGPTGGGAAALGAVAANAATAASEAAAAAAAAASAAAAAAAAAAAPNASARAAAAATAADAAADAAAAAASATAEADDAAAALDTAATTPPPTTLPPSATSTAAAMWVSVVAFWASDFFINALQGPSRTLLVDVAPPSQLALGNGLFSMWDSLGKITGFLFGSFEVAKLLPLRVDAFAGELFLDVQALFLLSIFAMALTQGVNQIAVREPPPAAAASDGAAAAPAPAGGSAVVAAFRLVPRTPLDVRATCAVLFCLFYTWFTTWLYLPAFMGEVVFGGRPDASLPDAHPCKVAYNEGARACARGMTFASSVTLVVGPALPALCRRIGEGWAFLLAEALHMAILLAATWITNPTLAVANIALLGAPFAAFLVIPYAIVGRAAAATDERGIYMAMQNLFLCLPELAVSLLGPLLVAIGGLRVPMMTAGLSCGVAVAIIYRYLVRRERHRAVSVPAAAAVEIVQNGEAQREDRI